MAKIAVVSADDKRLQLIDSLISQAANHAVQQIHAVPAQALTQPGLGQSLDLLIVEADAFSVDEINLLRRLLADGKDLRCMLLARQPSADLLMHAMRAGIDCVLPWPPQQQEFREEMQRCTAHAISASRNQAQVLSFLACKGGSGTTFTAANLGHALATRHGKRVLVVDLSQQYGDAAFLVTDQVPPATLSDVCQQIDRLDAALLDACLTHVRERFDVLAGAGDPIKAGEIKAVHLERIVALAIQHYDVVLFDVGQDINPASIQVLDHSHLIYPVLQQSLSHLRAGRRLLEICHSLGYRAERLRLTINQHDKRAPVSLAMLEDGLGMRAAHVLPYDPQVARESTCHGVPVLELAGGSAIARALMEMATELYPNATQRRDGLLRKLFGQGGERGAVTMPAERHA